ncbi:hypothetical protein EJB05_32535, partial [Eragrostis curvula]
LTLHWIAVASGPFLGSSPLAVSAASPHTAKKKKARGHRRQCLDGGIRSAPPKALARYLNRASERAIQGERMAAAVASLYRRVLPSPPAVDFASPEGKRLFSEALAAGTMEGFFSLVSCFQTQSEPAFCGLASLAVVLNALAIDPGRRWKGPWRWFDESMLDCCEPLDKVKAQGITFGKVACLAHCSGAKVQSFRANRASLEDFRSHLVRCVTSQDCHLIASYLRTPLQQENVLQQVRDTKLFTMVHDQQHANKPCCNCPSTSEEDSLTRIAAAVCCQGAAILSGNLASRDGFCCRETCLKCVQANGDGLRTVISGSVVSQGNEQGVDMLLPMSRPCTSSCKSSEITKYPSNADVLTVLLMALHPSTWLNIKDERLKAEVQTLVSTENLPDDLKREILHLRRQLYYLKAYKEAEEYEDPMPPSP